MSHCSVLQFNFFPLAFTDMKYKKKNYSSFTILPKFLHVVVICIEMIIIVSITRSSEILKAFTDKNK